MTNTNSNELPSVYAGDLLVELVGAAVRFWVAYDSPAGARRYRQVGLVDKIRGLPRTLWIYGDSNGSWVNVPSTIVQAQDLTPARIWSRKDPQSGFDLVKRYFPAFKVVHLCISGCGPSGHNVTAVNRIYSTFQFSS